MSGIELLSVNTQTGYGCRTGSTERDGNKQEFENEGTGLSGDLTLGLTAKKDDPPGRFKVGLNAVSAKADAIVGQDNDHYLRLVLNLGPAYQGDLSTYQGVRVAWLAAVTARAEHVGIKSNEKSFSGNNWNLSVPVAFGLGTSHIFLHDRFEAMTDFSGFRLVNEVSGSWRPYANFDNTFIQTVDVYFSHTYDLGKLPDGVEFRGTTLFAGLKLGLFNYTLK